MRDGSGMLPLCRACLASNPSLATVKTLLSQYPDAIPGGDYDGFLPLHLGFLGQASDEIIFALLDCFPKGAECKRSYGNFSPSACHLPLLVPNGLSTHGMHGNLPLHSSLQCMGGASFEVVNFLMDRFPDGVHFQNRHMDRFLLIMWETVCWKLFNCWWKHIQVQSVHAI